MARPHQYRRSHCIVHHGFVWPVARQRIDTSTDMFAHAVWFYHGTDEFTFGDIVDLAELDIAMHIGELMFADATERDAAWHSTRKSWRVGDSWRHKHY